MTELELAAIEFALKSFRYLLFNPKGFDLYTDHYTIVHNFAGKSPPATKNIASYVSFISEYNFDLFHIKGENNNLADLLSRSPEYVHKGLKTDEMVYVV